ncbi:MAG: LiaF transmembrane domain-containing protein [Anaerolineales bacterium]
MKNDRSRAAPLVGGTLLIAFGLLSLASQLFRNVVQWSYLWPLIIIVFGGLFFAGMFLGGRQVSGLAIPGAIITGIGLMLLYQNITSQWESWAYSWTLIVVFVGAGIFLMGLYGADAGQRYAGVRVMRIGLILFVVFGAFFEMIFSMDHSLGFRGLLFPSLLILLGVYLIVRRLGLLHSSTSGQTDLPIPPEPPSSAQ